MHVLDFRYIVLFWDLYMQWVKNWGQIWHFWLPVEIRGEVGDMSESIFRARLKTQPLIYFWQVLLDCLGG